MQVEQGNTLFDAVLATAGSLEDLFAFCALNNLGYSDDIAPGEVLQGSGLTYLASSVPNNDHITVSPVDVEQGQTLADMATQQLGSLEAWFALAKLNGLAYSDDLVSGQALNYSLTPYSKTVLKIYQDNGYKPATGTTLPGQAAPVQLQGIGYWAIGFDFITS